MLKLFKETFRTTNEGIILATPLVLFMWLLTLYIAYSKEVVDTIPEIILSAVTMLFMASAFCAGWFYMVKKCVEFSKKNFIMDSDKASESMKLMQALPVGVGKYFLTYVGVCLIFLAIALLMASILYTVSIPFIKNINFSFSQMATVINSPQDMKAFLDSLPPEQLYELFKLNIFLMVIPSVFSFLMMLWMPEVIYAERNPLLCLFSSIKKVFVKFRKSLILFIYISLVNGTISFLSTFAFLHPIAYMIMMIIYFYFIVYVVVLVFSYYDREFNNAEGEQTQSDSDSRSDG